MASNERANHSHHVKGSDLQVAYLVHAFGASHGQGHREDATWARDALDAMVRNDPDAAWPLLIDLVNSSPDDATLAYIAAGPLEDLIVLHGVTMIDRIESTAATNGRLRRALTGVWVEGDILPQLFERLKALTRSESPL
jgi:hypothetical protein